MVQVVGAHRMRVQVDATESITHASAASYVTTTSSAVRPEGNRSSTVSIQSGRFSGARFWKNGSLSAPSTYR